MKENMIDLDSNVIGYVFNKEGMYDKKYYFKGTAENIAKFIMQNQVYSTTITDTADTLICNSLPGGFIDRCLDKKFLGDELLPAIIPLQMEEEILVPLVFKENDYSYVQIYEEGAR